MDDVPWLVERAIAILGSPSLPRGRIARYMLRYIARISLASKFGTRTVIIVSVMIGPLPLRGARR